MRQEQIHLMISSDCRGKSLNIHMNPKYIMIIVCGLISILISVGIITVRKWQLVVKDLASYKQQVSEYTTREQAYTAEMSEYINMIDYLEKQLAEQTLYVTQTVEKQTQLQRAYDTLVFYEEKMEYVPTYIPCEGVVTSRFGGRSDPFDGGSEIHKGIDIGANYGDPIWAAAKGEVIESGVKNGYGNTILIDHGDGTKTRYAHASKLIAKEGQYVEKGDKIAEIGSTGNSTGPHLHFEWIEDDKQINPSKLFE